MKRLIRTFVNPEEASPHCAVGMLLDLTPDFIDLCLKRIALFKELHKKDSTLVYLHYWSPHFKAIDVYNIENEDWEGELENKMDEEGGPVEISPEQITAIDHSENLIYLDAIRAVVCKDCVFISGYGKHTDLRYETEYISEAYLKELQKLV